MSALSHGVPLLCLPLGRDQFFNAAMVERLGAGRALPGDADVRTLAEGLREMLGDDATRAGAKAMAIVIAGYGGAADAVGEIDASRASDAFRSQVLVGGGIQPSSAGWKASRRLSSRAGGGSAGRAPGSRTSGRPPRMNLPSDPGSSANTAPAHAPTRMAMAAPENQVTSASATPKKPNCSSLRVTTFGIQMVADTAKPAIATLVMTPEGISDPPAHLAEQEEPGGEPPQRERRRE